MSHTVKKTSSCMMLLFLAPVALADTEQGKAGKDESPQQLSVAPLDHVEYPEARPDWINQETDVSEEEARFVVLSGPCDTPEESLEELAIMQRAALATFIVGVTDSGGVSDFYPLSDGRIEGYVHRSYEGEVTSGDVIRYEHAVEMVIDDKERKRMEQAWQNVEVRDRLGALGVMIVGGLAVLMSSSAVLGMTTRRITSREHDGANEQDVA